VKHAEYHLAGNIIPKSGMIILHVNCSYLKLSSDPQYIREHSFTITYSISVNQNSPEKLTFPNGEVKDGLPL
jgi:hypothetical protein